MTHSNDFIMMVLIHRRTQEDICSNVIRHETIFTDQLKNVLLLCLFWEDIKAWVHKNVNQD